MKKVYIIGLGIGNKSFIHQRALELLEKSTCVLGAKRMLESFDFTDKEVFESINTQSIYKYILENQTNQIFAVLVSGDTGFYSLSKKLTALLSESKDVSVENIPAIGSLQYFSSKLNISWEGIKYLSAHGRSINIISNVIFNEKLFLLTGTELNPNNIAQILVDAGLGDLEINVGENLSYDNEKIITDTAKNIAKMSFESLSVMLIHNPSFITEDFCNRSIRDDEFITGKVPMTKSEVRTVSIGKLNLKSDFVVYDVGAGTGSVSIEIALKLTNGTLYAIEKNEIACDLIRQNKKKFKTYNIKLINELAPKGLKDLPKPDACFIGGSSGNMDEIIKVILEKNPFVNVVINTITLESLNEAIDCMEKYKLQDVEIVNLSVAKSKSVGKYHMMMGQNPIYVISGKGAGIGE